MNSLRQPEPMLVETGFLFTANGAISFYKDFLCCLNCADFFFFFFFFLRRFDVLFFKMLQGAR